MSVCQYITVHMQIPLCVCVCVCVVVCSALQTHKYETTLILLFSFPGSKMFQLEPLITMLKEYICSDLNNKPDEPKIYSQEQ